MSPSFDRKVAVLGSISVVAALLIGEVNGSVVYYTTPPSLGVAGVFFSSMAYYSILSCIIGCLLSLYFATVSEEHTVWILPHLLLLFLTILFYFVENSIMEVVDSFDLSLSNLPPGPGSESMMASCYVARAVPHYLFFLFIFPYAYVLRLSARDELPRIEFSFSPRNE